MSGGGLRLAAEKREKVSALSAVEQLVVVGVMATILLLPKLFQGAVRIRIKRMLCIYTPSLDLDQARQVWGCDIAIFL